MATCKLNSPRFIEANVPHAPHAQQLQVNASCSPDSGLILLTESAAAQP